MSNQPMNSKITLTLLSTIILLTVSCEKELDIASFTDDFSSYSTELRVEAILNAVNPMESMVRVDRTILITDTSLFNGRDDDGDWDPETDDTGADGVFASDGRFGAEKDEGECNGVPDAGEPHVDEIDEIISQLHDSTLTIQLFDNADGTLLMDFAYDAQADSFNYIYSTVGEIVFDSHDLVFEMIYYGGYRPTAVYGEINYHKEYRFELNTGTKLITGVTTPLPPAEYRSEGHLAVDDTLIISASGEFEWTTVYDATVTWVYVHEIVRPDSIVLITTHPSGPIRETKDGEGWVGGDIMNLYLPGLYRWTVAVPSREYGAYIYSNLPMRDEQLSNLRDDDDKVVLGIAGTTSPAVQYVRVPQE